MSTTENPQQLAASDAYEIEVVAAPLPRRALGFLVTLAVGIISAGEAVPYRNSVLVVRDRRSGEVVGRVVPLLANAVDEVDRAQRSWETDTKSDFDELWIPTSD
jgi:hypothetical protein